MVQVAKKHIHRHKKPLILVGVLAFLAIGFLALNFDSSPAFSAFTNRSYPVGDFSTQFPNCTGTGCPSHFEVLNDDPYDAGNYASTGTSTDSDLTEEFSMSSVSGPTDIVTTIDVNFHAYISGSCNGNGSSTCDTIDVRAFIDGAYQAVQSVNLTTGDTLHNVTFNGSWVGDGDLRLEFVRRVQGGGNPSNRDDDVVLSQVYADVTYIVGPSVTTNAASGVSDTAATFNGTVNPNADPTDAWFVWGTSAASCDSLPNTTPRQGMGSGASDVPFNHTESSLSPATTYYYCAAAEKSVTPGAIVYGARLSVTTDTAPPYVTTNPESGVTSSSANLNGEATPNGETTNAWFVWGNDASGGCSGLATQNQTSSQNIGTGTSSISFVDTIGGLLPSATYYYCAAAENTRGGPIYGAVEQLDTVPIPPTVTTDAPTNILARTATLNGSADPHGEGTTGWFRYSATNPGSCNDSFGTRAPLSGGTSLGDGRGAVPYSENISSLQPAITYYYCAIAENSAGKNFGSIVAFTTLADAPEVSTLPAQNVLSREADLWARVRPNGENTTVWFKLFQRGPGSPPNCSDIPVYMEPRVPQNSVDDVGAGSGTAFVDVSYHINDFEFILIPETDYWYCAVADNAQGSTTAGNPEYFRTLVGNPPIVETITPPAGVQDTSATLRARVNPNNGTTDVWFRYQADPGAPPASCDSLANITPIQDDVASDDTFHNFSEILTGLSANTTYYYCAYGANWDGTRFSTPMDSFSTAANPVDTNVAGWAWSSTTGWISFSSINCDSNNDTITDNAYYSGCPVGDSVDPYGVDIDYVTLTLSGWAWSSGVGWISFDRAVTGPPPATGGYDPTVDDANGDGAVDCASCIAVADRDSQKLYGWARAVSACNNNLWNGSACVDDTASGVSSWQAGNNAGGWDGWIRLDDVAISYKGAIINTTPLPDEVEGWAWGGGGNTQVVGWVSFNSLDSGSANQYATFLEDYGGAPTVENLDVTFERGTPTGGRGAGEEWVCRSYDRVMWNFSDTYPFEAQTAYQVQVTTPLDTSYAAPVFNSGKVASAAESRALEIGADIPLFSTDYIWRVRVWDSTDQPSLYIDGPQFRTSLYPYPRPNFNWVPEEPSEDEETVIFGNLTTAGGPNPLAWLWDIPGATYINGTSSTHPSPQVQFTNSGWRVVRLTATDSVLAGDPNYPGSGSGICYKEADMYVQFPIPEYDEINPVGLFWQNIKDVFAKINIFNRLDTIRDRLAFVF